LEKVPATGTITTILRDTIANCWRHVKYVADYEYEDLLVLRMEGLHVDSEVDHTLLIQHCTVQFGGPDPPAR